MKTATKRKKVSVYRLWLRLGDQGTYEAFGSDFDAIATSLRENGVKPEKITWREGGFVTPGFSGHDYISLYWGDRKGGWERPLRFEEQQELMRALTAEWLESAL
jgi:hypothetical protein